MSIDFDGSSDYIVIGDVPELSFDTSDAFSISAWVKPDLTSNAYKTIFSKRGSSEPNVGYWFGAYGFTLRFIISNADGKIEVLSAGGLGANKWTNVVVTYNGSGYASGVKLYIDTYNSAEQVVTDTLNNTGSIVNNFDAQIGAQSTIVPHNGLIEDLAVYNKELSQAEIDEIFNDGEHKYITDTSLSPSLTGYWVLQDGYGSVDGYNQYPNIVDLVNGNDGEMISMSQDSFSDDSPVILGQVDFPNTFTSIQYSQFAPDSIPSYQVDTVESNYGLIGQIPSSIEYRTISFNNQVYQGSDGDSNASVETKYKMRVRAKSGPSRYHYWISDTPDFDGAGASVEYWGRPHVVSKWTIYK